MGIGIILLERAVTPWMLSSEGFKGLQVLPRVVMMPSSGRFGCFMGACSSSLRLRSR